MKGVLFALAVIVGVPGCGAASPGEAPVYGYEVVNTYPHDAKAFTQGLFYLNGYLYESTGLKYESSIRKVRLETGEVLQKREIPSQYFGEGIVNWDDRLVELTWQAQVGFVYDLSTFELRRQFDYVGEGWGLTRDDRRIIMSDGTNELRFFEPKTLQEEGRISVTYRGQPVGQLNELEWVKGEIYANIWQTDWIARIDPDTGRVVGWIDLTGLLDPSERVPGQTDVLNGIAYDAEDDRLFVTGKRWPSMFEIRLERKADARAQ
jgi:glutamine cyclotransferase